MLRGVEKAAMSNLTPAKRKARALNERFLNFMERVH